MVELIPGNLHNHTGKLPPSTRSVEAKRKMDLTLEIIKLKTHITDHTER